MFTLEACCLGLATLGSAVQTPTSHPNIIVSILAFAMGMRNVTLQRFGMGSVSTTVLTSTLASLAGSGLTGRNWREVRPRLAAVGAMLLGAMCGALLIERGMLVVLGLATVLTIVVSFWTGERIATSDPRPSPVGPKSP
jgi:uncharacterized membrane protein YoaK (UPF0700 family)